MEKSEVLKKAQSLWIANFTIALAPLFFTVFILEFDKYEEVRLLLIETFSPYQTGFSVAIIVVFVLLVIQGYKFYQNVIGFNSEGPNLSNEEVKTRAASLKQQLSFSIKLAKLGLYISIPLYLSGLSYFYTVVLALPSVLAYVACYKIYYLRLT